VVKKIAGELEIENSSIPQQRSVAGGFFYWLDGKKHACSSAISAWLASKSVVLFGIVGKNRKSRKV